MEFWGKWACKGTFELKLGFGGNGCTKGLLGKIGPSFTFRENGHADEHLG